MKMRVIGVVGAVLLVVLGGWLIVHFSSAPAPETTKASGEITGKSKRAKNEPKPTRKGIPEGVRRTSWLSQTAKAPELSDEQISAFLESNHRSAYALLAASQIKNNSEYLHEAAQSFPENKAIQLELAIRGATLDEKLEAIERYRKLDPSNSVGDYLAALIHFQQSKAEDALANMETAEEHTEFQFPTTETRQAREDAYLSAGLSAVEAKAAALFGQSTLYSTQMNQLANYLVGSVPAGLQIGSHKDDENIKDRMLQSGLAFSRRISGSESLIMVDLMNLSIESRILRALPADTEIPGLGRTAAQRLEDLARARTELASLGKDVANIQTGMTEAEFLRYLKRVESEGEVNALRYLRDGISH